MAEKYRRNGEDLKEIRLILAIDKIMNEIEGKKSWESDEDIPPTLQKINNYLYFDK